MTTDTAAALRAAEIDAEVFLKATKVDGIFDSDPVKNSNAKLHRQLSFRQVMLDDLKVMDETAITMCKENDVKVGTDQGSQFLLHLTSLLSDLLERPGTCPIAGNLQMPRTTVTMK